jgi:hypothetical protein
MKLEEFRISRFDDVEERPSQIVWLYKGRPYRRDLVKYLIHNNNENSNIYINNPTVLRDDIDDWLRENSPSDPKSGQFKPSKRAPRTDGKFP